LMDAKVTSLTHLLQQQSFFFACLCMNERNRMLLNLRGGGSELGNLKP
jgi:hypothetical protein